MDHLLLDKLRPITDEEQEILNGRETVNTKLYNLGSSMVIDRQKLLDKGKLINLRVHTRFIHFPKHRHNYVEVVYMCSGCTTHLVNDEKVVLNTGELLFLNQNASHEIYPAAENDIAVNLIILPEFFDYSLSLIGLEENAVRTFLIDCLKSGGHDIGYLHFKCADILPVQNLMENLIWSLLHRQPARRSMTQITMGLLFLHLIYHTDRMEAGGPPPKTAILAVYRYIEEHYKNGSLTELSKRLGYDLHYLSRLIRLASGKTFTELLQDKRLNQSAYLLANTRLPITDICLGVGYSNFSYFYKLFAEKFENTPGEYREKNTVQHL